VAGAWLAYQIAKAALACKPKLNGSAGKQLSFGRPASLRNSKA